MTVTPANTAVPPAEAAPPRGHPAGLYLLFTTEMWERMSYYGMRALLTLYMVDRTRGGFGWSEAKALQIYGLYTGLVYLTPLGGGFLADRYLGQRRAVIIGGIMMMIGHFLMAVPGVAAFYAALTFLILGNGMFKPNISTMVGGLYAANDPRRDGAFTIFYMGINLGALLSPLVCGTLGEKVGWHWGFGAAGVGMGLGLTAFLLAHKRLLGNVGLSPGQSRGPAPDRGDVKFTGQDKDGYRSAAATEPRPAHPPLTRKERDRIVVIGVLALFTIVFWAAFEQAGGLMNLYTDQKVDRRVLGWLVPTTWFQSINPFFILVMAPMFSLLWVRLGRRGRDPSTPVKMGFGLLLLSLGFVFMLGASSQSAATGKASLGWVVGAYFFHTAGELCLSPVGLSMVTKMAPARYGSLLMGAWFLSSSAANYLAGVVGGFSSRLGEFQLFAMIVGVTAAAGLLLLVIAGPVRRLMHQDEPVTPAETEINPEEARERPV